MNLRRLAVLLLAGLLVCPAALAARHVSNGEYTAYAGTDGYLYLAGPSREAKRLRVSQLELLAMDEEKLYYAAGSTVYGIDLQKARASKLETDADAKVLRSYQLKGVYTLTQEGALYLGAKKAQDKVLAVCADPKTLYYAAKAGKQTALYTRPIKAGTGKKAPPVLTGSGDMALAVNEDYLVVLDGGRVLAYPLPEMKETLTVEVPQGKITDLFLIGGELYLYTEEGLQNLPLTVGNKAPTALVQTPANPTQEEAFQMIQRGSKGTRVKEVQKRLNELGYSAGKADGSYGSQSIRAVRAFQEAVGLEADGRVDSLTWECLFSEDAPRADE